MDGDAEGFFEGGEQQNSCAVQVKFICTDFFMILSIGEASAHPLHGESHVEVAEEFVANFVPLLERAGLR